MRDPADPAAPDETSPAGGGWLDVARVTFHHHLRGPWAVALAVLSVVGPAFFLLFRTLPPSFFVPETVRAQQAVPLLADVAQAGLPLVLLLLVVSAYRGAFLRDPGAARERVAGFFAGTWAAAVVALAPWAVAAFAIATWEDAAGIAFLAVLAHLLALALQAGAWTAIALVVAVAFRRDEARWVAAALVYAGSALVLGPGTFAAQTLTFLLMRLGETWVWLIDALNPTRLADLLPAVLDMASSDRAVFMPPALRTPLPVLLLFAAWILLPLLLAVRLQSRDEAPLPPLEQPF
jgi:hypothetical protein